MNLVHYHYYIRYTALSTEDTSIEYSQNIRYKILKGANECMFMLFLLQTKRNEAI